MEKCQKKAIFGKLKCAIGAQVVNNLAELLITDFRLPPQPVGVR